MEQDPLQALRPYMEKIQGQMSVFDQKLENLKDTKDESHKNILIELRDIKEQTTKTNGRVTELERKELYNKVARAALAAVAALIFYTVGGAILDNLRL